jgi:hypothetical protein
LILKHASASRPSGEWGEDDYDVLADGVVVGRINISWTREQSISPSSTRRRSLN